MRAESHEGAGPWSSLGRPRHPDQPPAGLLGGPAMRSSWRRTSSAWARWWRRTRTRGEQVTGYALGGEDADLFEIADSGALAFVDAPNFENPLGGANDDSNTYDLTVTATGGDGLRALSAERDYTVTVTDAGDERPLAPARPTFGAKTVASLVVEWTAPGNPGPPVLGLRRAVPRGGDGRGFHPTGTQDVRRDDGDPRGALAGSAI